MPAWLGEWAGVWAGVGAAPLLCLAWAFTGPTCNAHLRGAVLPHRSPANSAPPSRHLISPSHFAPHISLSPPPALHSSLGSGLVICPFDAVKIRAQTRGDLGTWGAARSLGFRGLWAGLPATMIWSVPSQGVFWMAHDVSVDAMKDGRCVFGGSGDGDDA